MIKIQVRLSKYRSSAIQGLQPSCGLCGMVGHTSTSKCLVGLEQKSTHARVQVTNFLEDHGRRILMEPEIGARSLRTVGYAPGLLVGKQTLHSERLLHRLQHYLQRKISNLLSTLSKATPRYGGPGMGSAFKLKAEQKAGTSRKTYYIRIALHQIELLYSNLASA